MTTDPYTTEAARLRAIVQDHLRAGTEPTLTPYEQLLLLGWYERELARLSGSIDTNYAERLEAERRSMAAVQALDRATTGHRAPPQAGWDGRTGVELDDHEGPP